MNWATLVAWALALWGWNGLPITVTETDLQLAAAVAHPDLFASCDIEVDPAEFPPEDAPHVILHEVGHCVGYWGNAVYPQHSTNPQSVMSVGNTGTTILAEDFAYIRFWRMTWMESVGVHQVVVPGLAR